VIKYVYKSRIIIDSWIRDRQLGSIPMELHILRKLQKFPHPNCCRLVTSMEDDDYYFIVMELLGDGMDLFGYIESNQVVQEQEIRHIFYQVTKAVQHLHQHQIVHRDIKDENIILDEDGRVHLIDFGCAAYYKRGRKFDTFSGTLEYCAPEILNGQSYDGPPQDVWASGVLLYTLMYRENPFHTIDEIIESELTVPSILSEDAYDLLTRMLERNVDERITINQVLLHPWFKDIE
jgi:serine/threonine protein kinase